MSIMICIIILQLKNLGIIQSVIKSIGSGATSIEAIVSATEGLSLANTAAILTTTGLSEADKIAILMTRGLTEEEAKEALATATLSTSTGVLATIQGKATVATTGFKNALSGLGAVIKANPLLIIVTAATLVVAGLNKIKQSIDETAEELRTKAAESADTLTESLSNLGDYQKKIEDLKDAINSDDISQSEATEKRKQLLEIQEELIKKYGKEKEAIDYITESIQGETSALGNLQTIAAQNYLNNNIKQIEEASNYLTKLNEQTAPLPFTTVGVGQDPTVVKYEHYADLVSKQIAPMAELLYTDAGKTGVNGISFKGNYEELISQYDEVLSNIRKYLSDNPIDGNSSDEEKWEAEKLRELESYISGLRSRIDNDEELQKYKKIYNTALDSVLLTSKTYSEYYNKLIETKKKYTEALASGNQDEINKAYTELRDLFNKIFSLDFLDEDNVSGESIKAWFEGVKQQIELQSKETPIIIDVQAELKDSPDGYANKIKTLSSSKGYTASDLKSIIAKGDLGEDLGDDKDLYDTIKGYVDLWNGIAQNTGQATITTDEYITALEKVGVIQKEVAEGSESSFALSKDQTKELKSVHSDVDKLNKAYQNLFAGKLTTNDVAELVDLFPTLGEYVDWTDEKFGNLAEGIDKVIKERPQELISQLEGVLNTQDLSDEAKKSIQSMIAALKQLKPEIKDTKTLIEEIQKVIKGVSSSISTLIGFTKEISENGSLSLSSIDTIMTDDTYKSLRPYINDMEGMQAAIDSLTNKQKFAYESLYNEQRRLEDPEGYHKAIEEKEKSNDHLLKDSIEKINTQIQEIEKKYNVDLSNWSNLSAAKQTLLQNTNAELLSKQRQLINEFAESYNVDLTKYKDATAAKLALYEEFKRRSDNFRKTEVFDKVTKIAIDSHSLSNSYGQLTFTADDRGKKAQDDIDNLLKSYGLTWQDYVAYLQGGRLPDSANEKISRELADKVSKDLDKIIQPYKISPQQWANFTKNQNSSSNNSSSKSNESSSTSSTAKTKNYFDWIERRLKYFATNTKNVFSKVKNYISFTGKNSQLDKAMNAVSSERSFNERAYNYYIKEANKVGLSNYYKKFAQEGGSNISSITDEKLREKIIRYQELYDKAMSCREAVDSLKETEKEYAKQQLDNITTYYDNRIKLTNSDNDYFNNLDKDTRNVRKNYKQIGNNYKKIEKYETDKAKDLDKKLQTLIKRGIIQVGDDDYYKYKSDIQTSKVNARNAANQRHQLSIEELGDIQTYWQNKNGVYDSKINMINIKSGDSTRNVTKNYNNLKSYYNEQKKYALNEAGELQKKLDEAVRNGNIEKYSKAWYEWTQNIKKAKENAEELKKTINELSVEEFNDIAKKFDNEIDRINGKASRLNESITQTQEKGYIVSTKYYVTSINNEIDNKNKLIEKRNELINKRDKAVNTGAIQKGSQAWHDMTGEIEKVDLAIQQADTSIIKFNKSIREVRWQLFDLLQSNISAITQESDFLSDLMKDDKLYKDQGQKAGQLTREGLSIMGLHGVDYNVYLAQADKYAKEIKRINEEIAKDPYNQDLIKRRDELLKQQQQSILAANNEKKAIVDMVKNGIEYELKALKKLIDNYNEALDSQKNLYDYQKNIKNQTKEIASLQKQLSAYSGDSSEETKAKVQQLKVSLEKAKEDLEETQYDKFITDQKKLLDNLYDGYETTLNQRFDDVDALISDMINEINNSVGDINKTLSEEAKNVGYQISSNMSSIWNDSAHPVISDYNNNFLSVSNNVINVINKLSVSIDNMVNALNKDANTNTSQTNTKLSATKTTTNKQSSNNTNSSAKGMGASFTNSSAKGMGASFTNSSAKGMGASFTNSDSKNIKTKKKYNTGAYRITSNQSAWTQENNNPEIIIRRSDGAILTPLLKDDMILNNNATNNLFSMMNDPSEFIKSNLFDKTNNTGSISVNNNANNISVHLDNITFNMPNVKNYDEFINTMQRDKKFELLIKSMTTDRLFGGSSLKKYHL